MTDGISNQVISELSSGHSFSRKAQCRAVNAPFAVHSIRPRPSLRHDNQASLTFSLMRYVSPSSRQHRIFSQANSRPGHRSKWSLTGHFHLAWILRYSFVDVRRRMSCTGVIKGGRAFATRRERSPHRRSAPTFLNNTICEPRETIFQGYRCVFDTVLAPRARLNSTTER